MPLMHCTKCHHEWPGTEGVCSWCGAPGKMIAEELPEDKFWRKWKVPRRAQTSLEN